MNIEAGEGYRLLEVGETVLATDEVFNIPQNKWVAAIISVGTDVRFPGFRRKLPALCEEAEAGRLIHFAASGAAVKTLQKGKI